MNFMFEWKKRYCSFQITSKIFQRKKVMFFSLYAPDFGMVFEINTTLAKMVHLEHETRRV